MRRFRWCGGCCEVKQVREGQSSRESATYAERREAHFVRQKVELLFASRQRRSLVAV